jgi:phosphatidylserine/phosphatidylglycerophosphate/cardiolipin synthase-like enzyme
MRRGRQVAGRRRAVAARALVLGLAGVWLSGTAMAAGPRRVTPENALQPPGASFEGYPEIGRAQRAAIAREVIVGSARSVACTPLASVRHVVGRTVERLSVRGREVSTSLIDPRPWFDDGPGLDLAGDAGGPPFPARLTLLPSSEAAVQALLAQVAAASRRVDLMIYGWEDDPTGREVAAALADRARQGVRVRLLVDRGGFITHNPGAADGRGTFLDALRTVPNVSVIEPENPFLRFDHRKLALVDGRVAWTGGMILTEVARRRWQNLAFLAEGPIVAEYAALFEARWCEVGGCPEGPVAPEATAAPPPNATVRMIRTDAGERSLKSALYHAVDHARCHIYLANPYFSDEILTDKLVEARERGVDVRAILTLRGNMRLLNQYSALTANRLLRGGVRVYLYPAMTHVKAMSADGDWAYLGTGNFDELSLRNNREVGLSVTSPEVVGELDRTVFLPDMAASQELTALLPVPRNRVLLELFSLWY